MSARDQADDSGLISVVVAEFDPSTPSGTSDGEHFVMLAAFVDDADAQRYLATVQASGRWGRFCGDAIDPEVSDTGWSLTIEPVPLHRR